MKTHIFTQKFIWITFLFILYSNSILAQQISVTGTVIGTDDEPIIGVSILVKGTTQGVITDLNGNYTINTNSDATLVFSYVGWTRVPRRGGRGRGDGGRRRVRRGVAPGRRRVRAPARRGVERAAGGGVRPLRALPAGVPLRHRDAGSAGREPGGLRHADARLRSRVLRLLHAVR